MFYVEEFRQRWRELPHKSDTSTAHSESWKSSYPPTRISIQTPSNRSEMNFDEKLRRFVQTMLQTRGACWPPHQQKFHWSINLGNLTWWKQEISKDTMYSVFSATDRCQRSSQTTAWTVSVISIQGIINFTETIGRALLLIQIYAGGATSTPKSNKTLWNAACAC